MPPASLPHAVTLRRPDGTYLPKAPAPKPPEPEEPPKVSAMGQAMRALMEPEAEDDPNFPKLARMVGPPAEPPPGPTNEELNEATRRLAQEASPPAWAPTTMRCDTARAAPLVPQRLPERRIENMLVNREIAALYDGHDSGTYALPEEALAVRAAVLLLSEARSRAFAAKTKTEAAAARSRSAASGEMLAAALAEPLPEHSGRSIVAARQAREEAAAEAAVTADAVVGAERSMRAALERSEGTIISG